jgi:hypothetical protein
MMSTLRKTAHEGYRNPFRASGRKAADEHQRSGRLRVHDAPVLFLHDG